MILAVSSKLIATDNLTDEFLVTIDIIIISLESAILVRI